MTDEQIVEAAALAFAKEFYGPGFDPFSNPEAYDLAEKATRKVLPLFGQVRSEGKPQRRLVNCDIGLGVSVVEDAENDRFHITVSEQPIREGYDGEALREFMRSIVVSWGKALSGEAPKEWFYQHSSGRSFTSSERYEFEEWDQPHWTVTPIYTMKGPAA